MQMTDTVKKILANYEGENPGVKGNLARMLMTGKLAGTGKMIILPVDQGFEHGPARSFGVNVGFSRWLVFTVISVIIGGCVAVSGVIGWVGLVIPHAARLLVGESHRRFHGTAALLGFGLGWEGVGIWTGLLVGLVVCGHGTIVAETPPA